MRNQATRNADLLAQQRRRRTIRDTIIALPVIAVAATVIAYAIVGFALPAPL